jgi:hypothetical protein
MPLLDGVARLAPSLLTGALLLLPRLAFCQGFILGPPSAGTGAGELQVGISSKSDGSAPPFETVGNKDFWRVTVYRKSGARLVPAAVEVTGVSQTSLYTATGIVLLSTSATDSLDANLNPLVVEVTFLGGPAILSAWFPADGTPKGPRASSSPSAPKSAEAQSSSQAASSSTSTGCAAPASASGNGGFYYNYCLSGIWVPQVGSHPLYSTNSNFLLGEGLAHHTMFGLAAQESADSSVVLDPNAFSSAIFFRGPIWEKGAGVMGIHLNSVRFNWNIATVEFDRKKKNTNLGTNVNLITAPELLFPFSLPYYFGLELTTGIEAGENFRNNVNPDGFGEVFRGLLGAELMRIFTYPKPHPILKTIKFTSQYRARLLEENEVITRSLHGKLVAGEGHQTRNWVSTEVDFMFTLNFGVTLKHDYGALPHGFVFIENRASVGFTLQGSQK